MLGLMGLRIALAAALLMAAPLPSVSAEEGVSAAIGRANYAGFRDRRHCTAFAVGPRTVITAAHCIDGLGGAMTILFGYDRGEWQAEAVTVSAKDVGQDVAVLCLGRDSPASLTIAADGAGPGAATQLVGYGKPRVHAQQRRDCPVMAPVGGDLLLRCPASPGFSGGPLLNTDGEVVGVMSRTGRGTSYAADVAGLTADCPG